MTATAEKLAFLRQVAVFEGSNCRQVGSSLASSKLRVLYLHSLQFHQHDVTNAVNFVQLAATAEKLAFLQQVAVFVGNDSQMRGTSLMRSKLNLLYPHFHRQFVIDP